MTAPIIAETEIPALKLINQSSEIFDRLQGKLIIEEQTLRLRDFNLGFYSQDQSLKIIKITKPGNLFRLNKDCDEKDSRVALGFYEIREAMSEGGESVREIIYQNPEKTLMGPVVRISDSEAFINEEFREELLKFHELLLEANAAHGFSKLFKSSPEFVPSGSAFRAEASEIAASRVGPYSRK